MIVYSIILGSTGLALFVFWMSVRRKLRNASQAKADKALSDAIRCLTNTATQLGIPPGGDGARNFIEHILSVLERRISKQIDLVLMEPELCRLQQAWRGLHHLVSTCRQDFNTKIVVFNASKSELANSFKPFSGKFWDQSPLYRIIYEANTASMGTFPYSCVVGDYYFNKTEEDIQCLAKFAQICERACCPFIAATGTTLVDAENSLACADSRRAGSDMEFDLWHSLRLNRSSRFLGLTVPVASAPKSDIGMPLLAEEASRICDLTRRSSAEKIEEVGSVYLFAQSVLRSYLENGWCARITCTDEDASEAKESECRGDDAFTTGEQTEAPAVHLLAKQGFIPISGSLSCFCVHRSNSINLSPLPEDEGLALAVKRNADLTYVFAASYIAHRLMCISRDMIFTRRSITMEEAEEWLASWLACLGTHWQAGEETRSHHPLSGSTISLRRDPNEPLFYVATFSIKPIFRFPLPPTGVSMTAWLRSFPVEAVSQRTN